jgi:hypothetical protein
MRKPWQYPTRPLEERFWEKVQKGEGCWEWQAATNKFKYGTFSNGSGASKTQKNAHRWAWELTFGPIKDGLYVLHRCDNPLCVRPDHLRLGTQQENIREMHQKGRGWQERYPERIKRAEDHWLSKMTWEKVREMRARFDAGESAKSLGGDYGIKNSQAQRICTRKSWVE